MRALEFRKVFIFDMRFDAGDGMPVLDAQGYPVTLRDCPTLVRVGFWIPQPAPYRRRDGVTEVLNATQEELQALSDGVIEEQTHWFRFDRMPTQEETRKPLLEEWERRTLASLGFLPNKPPEDHDAKARIAFAATG